MKVFSKRELAACDGRDGAPAFVAYDGSVYDVSQSFLWQAGVHQVLHRAGQDLTNALRDAPHGWDLLGRFPAVGVLRDD